MAEARFSNFGGLQGLQRGGLPAAPAPAAAPARAPAPVVTPVAAPRPIAGPKGMFRPGSALAIPAPVSSPVAPAPDNYPVADLVAQPPAPVTSNVVAQPSPIQQPQPQPVAFETGAKDISYSTPGDAAIRHGMTPDNIFAPGQFLDKFQNDAVEEGITTGGNRNILASLRSNKNILGQNPAQATLLRQYLTSGTVPEGLSPQFALNAYDWAIRREARRQQTKPPSFLQRIAGPAIAIATRKALGPIGSQIAGNLVGRTLTKPDPLASAARLPVQTAPQTSFVTLPGGEQVPRNRFGALSPMAERLRMMNALTG